MKTSLLLFLITIISSFTNQPDNQQNTIYKFKDITRHLSVKEFEEIKSFVLKNGDRQTYCMKVGNNPHFSFDGFELYLHPEVGQKNMSCDPNISDFNLMNIRDINTFQQYHKILIIRKGDLKNKDISSNLPFPSGMREGRVYVLQQDEEHDLKLSVKYVKKYIQVMKKKLKETAQKR